MCCFLVRQYGGLRLAQIGRQHVLLPLRSEPLTQASPPLPRGCDYLTDYGIVRTMRESTDWRRLAQIGRSVGPSEASASRLRNRYGGKRTLTESNHLPGAATILACDVE